MKLALCHGRHRFPRDCKGFIFEKDIKQPTNMKYLDGCVKKRFGKIPYRLDVYVTGYTPALVSVINFCFKNSIWLVLWHYDRDEHKYYPQSVETLKSHAS